MISPPMILGFKLDVITVSICAFVVGVLLQIINSKVKRIVVFTKRSRKMLNK